MYKDFQLGQQELRTGGKRIRELAQSYGSPSDFLGIPCQGSPHENLYTIPKLIAYLSASRSLIAMNIMMIELSSQRQKPAVGRICFGKPNNCF